ncbi:Rieske (2Fe-2S) protein [Immundisolibacter sp.]|uniref:Rieske (2Fe-2S) protein n=1 Tax=Immundisolibacter sp. TaxID=1934948 RepID=UPI0035674DD5
MLRTRDAHGKALWLFGQTLGELPAAPRPDWQAAEPRWIAGALARALDRPGGGWHVLGASAALRQRPLAVQVEGRSLALWRSQAGVHATDDQCPHLGAAWSRGRLVDGGLVCPWHGLRLDPAAPCSALYQTHDDGALVWVQLPGEALLPRPVLPVRPTSALVSVMSLRARCTPREVLENRLDPWHGAHFHGHSFARLAVREQAEDSITVRVAFRVAGRLAVEVDARFHCPDRRSIVMTIVAGEGEGSLVETHATALSPGQCLITEAIFASSTRSGFAVARRLGRLIQPLMRLAARRLWVEDAAYCERRHALRERASPPDLSCASQESSP